MCRRGRVHEERRPRVFPSVRKFGRWIRLLVSGGVDRWTGQQDVHDGVRGGATQLQPHVRQRAGWLRMRVSRRLGIELGRSDVRGS